MPATSIREIYKFLQPTPLLTRQDLDDFYSVRVNRVRGQDVVARFKLALERTAGKGFYKAFLVGHSGVGKSTELTRLICDVEDNFRALRFSATRELDPGSFQPFDILLLILADAVEVAAKPRNEGGLDATIPDALLEELWNWFASENETTKAATHKSAEFAAGFGVPKDSWCAKILGLFAHLKGEVKYASSREKERVEYRLNRLATLIDVANRLLDFCNRTLRNDRKREWLFIGEDFDKPGIRPELIRQLFITYSNVFKDLRTHLIFTIPAALANSSQAPQLPFPSDRILFIPDTPVYRQDHQPHNEGRRALVAIVKQRVDPKLFKRGQIMRLDVASGGNLRDLFALINEAADHAILRGDQMLGREDVDAAINRMRAEYLGRLGISQFDEEEAITYERKAERLVSLHGRDPNAQVPDAVLYSLLRSRAVQEFNGKRWYGIHPLVVDILKEQGKLTPDEEGKVPGGLE
ncbi:MAG: hypothetical protein EXS05_03040 [Planctomycetaceae bacterium]|nr:hypothetical protein [Planctomycetaceae bacterium]